MSDAEDIAKMDMPCVCRCGEFFDLNDGNPCRSCKEIWCEDCLEQPFEDCPNCVELRDE